MNNSDIMIRFSKELITEWTFAMLFISIFLECNLVISKSNSIQLQCLSKLTVFQHI